MTVKKALPPELEAAVARARAQAELAGELEPKRSRDGFPVLPEEATQFVRDVLSDGSYVEEIRRLGAQDSEIAAI